MVSDIARYHLATLLRNGVAEGKPSPKMEVLTYVSIQLRKARPRESPPRELEGMQENPVKGEANQNHARGQPVTSHE